TQSSTVTRAIVTTSANRLSGNSPAYNPCSVATQGWSYAPSGETSEAKRLHHKGPRRDPSRPARFRLDNCELSPVTAKQRIHHRSYASACLLSGNMDQIFSRERNTQSAVACVSILLPWFGSNALVLLSTRRFRR